MKYPPAHIKQPVAKKRGFFGTVFMFIGDLAITVGMVLLLFVVWQLWWTTVKVEGPMKERIATFQTAYPSKDEYVEKRRYDNPPIMAMPEYGQVMGVIHVPKWDQMSIPAQQGTDSWILDTGNAGHYEQTQLPGEIGNSAFAGHRRTYGNNFRQVHIMESGDPIIFETDTAWLVYEVTGHEIVDPNQSSVLLPVPNEPSQQATKRIFTMTTCDPEFGNTHRFILYSEFAYWVAKSDGIPIVLKGAN